MLQFQGAFNPNHVTTASPLAPVHCWNKTIKDEGVSRQGLGGKNLLKGLFICTYPSASIFLLLDKYVSSDYFATFSHASTTATWHRNFHKDSSYMLCICRCTTPTLTRCQGRCAWTWLTRRGPLSMISQISLSLSCHRYSMSTGVSIFGTGVLIVTPLCGNFLNTINGSWSRSRLCSYGS